MRRNAFVIFSLVFLSTIVLQSCSSNGSSSNLASAFSCSVLGTTSGTTIINPTVSIYSGNGGPYTFTYNGQTLGSTSSTSFTIPETVTTGGVVTVTDSSDGASATCTVGAGTTGTTGYSNGVTVYANGQLISAGSTYSVPTGTTQVTLSATSVSGSQTFTFSIASAVSGIYFGNGQTTYSGNSVPLTDASNVAGTVAVTITDATNSTYTAQVSLAFNGGSGTGYYGYNGSSVGCTLSHTPGTYLPNATSIFYLVATTGEELEVTQWYPGVSWSTPPSYPFIPQYCYTQYGQVAQCLEVIYSTAGQMNIYVTAQSLSRPGVVCVSTTTGSTQLTDSVYIQ